MLQRNFLINLQKIRISITIGLFTVYLSYAGEILTNYWWHYKEHSVAFWENPKYFRGIVDLEYFEEYYQQFLGTNFKQIFENELNNFFCLLPFGISGIFGGVLEIL